MISANTALTAVFAQESGFAAHRNGVFYTMNDGGLPEALADAVSGDIVVMLENHTFSSNVTIPAGVKLYIPYGPDFDADGSADGVTTQGSPYQASINIAPSSKTYRTLTINEGVTITVNGTVSIGSVIGYPSQNYQGHTSGWHGKIVNDGEIIVTNGGTLDCWGLITGNGAVTAESGSAVSVCLLYTSATWAEEPYGNSSCLAGYRYNVVGGECSLFKKIGPLVDFDWFELPPAIDNRDRPVELMFLPSEAGTYEITVTLQTVEGVELAVASHTVRAGARVVGVADINDLVVDFGTLLDDLELPESVEIILADNTRCDASVSWNYGTPIYNCLLYTSRCV